MISAEERAEIRRLFYAEHWKVGTIAAALGVHRDTVALAIEAERFLARHDARPRPSRLDPVLRDAPGPRLCRVGRATPAGRGETPTGRTGRGLPAAAGPPRRAGAGGLGLLRHGRHGPREAAALVLRDGARVVPGAARRLHPRPDHGELSARPRRGLRFLPGRRPDRAVR